MGSSCAAAISSGVRDFGSKGRSGPELRGVGERREEEGARRKRICWIPSWIAAAKFCSWRRPATAASRRLDGSTDRLKAVSEGVRPPDNALEGRKTADGESDRSLLARWGNRPESSVSSELSGGSS
eukprot:CAMPEP_0175044604 /NCGR_PEP_ID=MMETSP0052_2-20121109/3914_1 /TAXON_ID=51329 ORGANISM="Polytomella parva, Strain SAG 63-3" /NCGR_SAMPLE_ID=MMETSP0052_2 /ASSEMBLY_ACC=CAM_ASM_000194 /LENGTH=125 /DNA_ID=CAMNT_0016307951 /DNA_START=126 /DNA_END=503 /DNA_ORIENTATION=+